MPDLFDIGHGPGGLWEVHTWNPAFGPTVDLNEQDVLPQYRIDSITGLHSLPDHEVREDPKVGRTGTNQRPDSFGGKTVVYTGEIRAENVPDLREARSLLVAGFADLRTPGTMQIVPHADAGGPTVEFTARPMQLDIGEEQTSNYFRRQFTLGLRLADPRFYFPSLAVSETGSSSVTVSNDGTAPADPVITIAGASGAVTVGDGTHILTFADVPSGSLVIDFAARTAMVGTDHAPFVVSTSDWWDSFVDGITPGVAATISQTGGSGITVEFTPSVWA